MTDPLTYFRFFGHVLGHVSFEHYLNNFLLILLLGPMLEEKYGSGKLAVMIVVTAFITGAASFIIFPSRMILGASGIAFMLILLSSYVNIQKGRIPLTLILCVVIFIGREIFSGIFEQNDIANLSHIIGGACGAVFGYFIKMSHPDASGEVSV
jgi:membrane associated rhomboid family serine protease